VQSLHASVAASAAFAGELVGLTAGLLITVLLLVLTLRTLKLPGAPAANVVFAACALCWTAGGLADAALQASEVAFGALSRHLANGLQFLGAVSFPIPILATWRLVAARPTQRIALRYVQVLAVVSAACLAGVLLQADLSASGSHRLAMVQHLPGYNAAIFLSLGAAIVLRRKSAPRAIYIPSSVIVAAMVGSTVAMTIARSLSFTARPGATLSAIGSHLLLFVVLGSFFLFARFRFADVFVRYSVRILLAGAFAIVLAVAAHWIVIANLSGHAPRSAAFHVFGITLLAAVLMLVFAFADEPLTRFVNRWLFHSPDYRACSRQLAETLRGMQAESDVATAVEDSVRYSLVLEGARLVSLDRAALSGRPEFLLEGEIVELSPADPVRSRLPLPNVEFVVPIRSAAEVSHLLLISPGPSRPALVTNDLIHLRTVAAQCGSRLDALRLERETVARQTREALLLQQVTEAELRALRSQVNPHFLFNSLNTIADLIVKDPSRAEEMTLRLADVFRHVLAHSSRSLTSISDEVEFLRTYLYIEEVRFRDRLQVEIDVAPEIASERIPSLILQPLVENALKHGLGPKPGPGHLWISARAEGDQVQVRVEDDGIGPHASALRRVARSAEAKGLSAGGRTDGQGLGLANVAERLRTLYRDEASVTFEPRELGGSRVTLLLPRARPVEAP